MLSVIIIHWLNAQSVGIGTTNPNAGSILDLGQGGKPLILPRLTSSEMNAVSPVAQGMIIYNTTEHQLYSWMRYRSSVIIGQSTSRWQPITTGPAMLAWGVVDSFGVVKTGSGNFSVVWNATESWFTLTITSHPYYKDSMLLMINPVGNGSWDQVVSTGEMIEGSIRRATIKFTDVSRTALNWSAPSNRRRSWFHFVVYDLRKDPYNTLSP
ncbi:MAG TPA: hypothetical protein VK907_04320 [Phnomibacter sp.]|nr:hypothetical protein [Phnomibacter sp.]